MKRLVICLLAAFTLVGLWSGAALAKKPVLGVAEFRNTSGAGWWRGGMGSELSGLLTSELASSGEFRVVERNKLSKVLREQDLGASGRVRRRTAAKIGKITGAQYLVIATVTSYEESVKGTGGGFSIGPISLGGKKEDAYISVDLRVVDTTTGEIAYSRAIEAKSSGGGLSGGLHLGIFSGHLGGFEKTPAGKAVRACIIEIVDYLECAMVYKDDCMQEFRGKEKRRREKTKKAISLDE
jgi:curli biogenesis system outer membrane secretion channel CsgG